MHFSYHRLVVLAAALAGLLIPAAATTLPALGKTVPHLERCVGTLDVITPTTMEFSGTGVATHFGVYSIEGQHGYDDQGNVSDGQFTTTTADGATISGIYAGTYSILSDGKISFDVEVVWLAGTGRLKGVTGQGDVIALLDAAIPGARVEYTTSGTLTFP